MTTGFGKEKMMNGFMNPFPIRHEPEVDHTQRSGNGALNTSLLRHFAQRRLFGRFAGFNVPFR